MQTSYKVPPRSEYSDTSDANDAFGLQALANQVVINSDEYNNMNNMNTTSSVNSNTSPASTKLLPKIPEAATWLENMRSPNGLPKVIPYCVLKHDADPKFKYYVENNSQKCIVFYGQERHEFLIHLLNSIFGWQNISNLPPDLTPKKADFDFGYLNHLPSYKFGNISSQATLLHGFASPYYSSHSGERSLLLPDYNYNMSQLLLYASCMNCQLRELEAKEAKKKENEFSTDSYSKRFINYCCQLKRGLFEFWRDEFLPFTCAFYNAIPNPDSADVLACLTPKPSKGEKSLNAEVLFHETLQQLATYFDWSKAKVLFDENHLQELEQPADEYTTSLLPPNLLAKNIPVYLAMSHLQWGLLKMKNLYFAFRNACNLPPPYVFSQIPWHFLCPPYELKVVSAEFATQSNPMCLRLNRSLVQTLTLTSMHGHKYICSLSILISTIWTDLYRAFTKLITNQFDTSLPSRSTATLPKLPAFENLAFNKRFNPVNFSLIPVISMFICHPHDLPEYYKRDMWFEVVEEEEEQGDPSVQSVQPLLRKTFVRKIKICVNLFNWDSVELLNWGKTESLIYKLYNALEPEKRHSCGLLERNVRATFTEFIQFAQYYNSSDAKMESDPVQNAKANLDSSESDELGFKHFLELKPKQPQSSSCKRVVMPDIRNPIVGYRKVQQLINQHSWTLRHVNNANSHLGLFPLPVYVSTGHTPMPKSYIEILNHCLFNNSIANTQPNDQKRQQGLQQQQQAMSENSPYIPIPDLPAVPMSM